MYLIWYRNELKFHFCFILLLRKSIRSAYQQRVGATANKNNKRTHAMKIQFYHLLTSHITKSNKNLNECWRVFIIIKWINISTTFWLWKFHFIQKFIPLHIVFNSIVFELILSKTFHTKTIMAFYTFLVHGCWLPINKQVFPGIVKMFGSGCFHCVYACVHLNSTSS